MTTETQHIISSPLKSEAQQKQEQRQLFLRCLLTPTEYELYGFNRADKSYAYMLNFLSIHDLRHKFRPGLNDTNWKAVLDNKWFFHLHYNRLGISLPRTYGVYQPNGGTTIDGKPLGTRQQLRAFFDSVRPASLVIKPVGGIMGRGVLILDTICYDGESISAVTNTGQVIAFEDIVEKLNTPPQVRYQMTTYELDLPGYILQEKLKQHEFLNSIAPFTMNTMRVVTFMDCNSKVHAHFGILRLGRQGNAVDNWDKGGISVALDLATGVLGRGVLKPKYGGKWVETHPDTGVAFSGLRIPHWDEILRLCLRAAEGTPSLRTIGWDVALTSEGPVLIEGNPDWDLPMVQVHTAGLLQPDVRRQLEEFGLTFDRDKLPPISIHRWWMWFVDRQRRSQYSRETLSDRFMRRFRRLLGR